MTWTDTVRWQHNREEARYPSELKDGEWALIEQMLLGDGCEFIYCVERLRLADTAQMLRAGFDGTRYYPEGLR